MHICGDAAILCSGPEVLGEGGAVWKDFSRQISRLFLVKRQGPLSDLEKSHLKCCGLKAHSKTPVEIELPLCSFERWALEEPTSKSQKALPS